jgi:hypothetical protein
MWYLQNSQLLVSTQSPSIWAEALPSKSAQERKMPPPWVSHENTPHWSDLCVCKYHTCIVHRSVCNVCVLMNRAHVEAATHQFWHAGYAACFEKWCMCQCIKISFVLPALLSQAQGVGPNHTQDFPCTLFTPVCSNHTRHFPCTLFTPVCSNHTRHFPCTVCTPVGSNHTRHFPCTVCTLVCPNHTRYFPCTVCTLVCPNHTRYFSCTVCTPCITLNATNLFVRGVWDLHVLVVTHE